MCRMEFWGEVARWVQAVAMGAVVLLIAFGPWGMP